MRAEGSQERLDSGGRGGRGARGRSAAGGAPAYSRKEKALGLLSQRFIQLFLASPTGELHLEAIAVSLLGAAPQHVKKKPVRRQIEYYNTVVMSLLLIVVQKLNTSWIYLILSKVCLPCTPNVLPHLLT